MISSNEKNNSGRPIELEIQETENTIQTCESTATLNRAVTRREFLQATGMVCTASVMAVAGSAYAEGDDDDDEDEIEDEDEATEPLPPSPETKPWVMQLPEKITYLKHLTDVNGKTISFTPPPTKEVNLNSAEAGRGAHQHWELCDFINFTNHEYCYELYAIELENWTFNPAYPPQPHWGYQGDPSLAMATAEELLERNVMSSAIVAARYGHPVLCRIHNYLPQSHSGFGTPEISTHLHNLHTASESDGFAGDYYGSKIKGPTLSKPGEYKDHLYTNFKAGFADRVKWPDGKGDPSEALGTLFYHDHTENFTAANVVRGLAGFYLLFDDIDSGNENDCNPKALRLPSGNYDYPFNICDRRFDQTGMLYFDQLSPEGTLGDKIIINGRIEPVWNVKRRRYRMRLLNSGPSRFYDLAIINAKNETQGFVYIANDGNLLEYPLMNTKSIRLGVAERADIIMDFSTFKGGDVIYLVNRLEQNSTRKPDKVSTPGKKIMKIVISSDAVKDPSVTLTATTMLRPLPNKFKLTEDDIEKMNVPVRRWEFARSGGFWTVNDKIFDVTKPVVKIKKGTAEVWELVNDSGGWAHPIHIHFEEGRVLSKIVDGDRVAVPPHERGRKDVFVLEPGSTTRIYIEFRDFTGKYMMHCHNVIHEDHAMMVRFDVIE